MDARTAYCRPSASLRVALYYVGSRCGRRNPGDGLRWNRRPFPSRYLASFVLSPSGVEALCRLRLLALPSDSPRSQHVANPPPSLRTCLGLAHATPEP